MDPSIAEHSMNPLRLRRVGNWDRMALPRDQLGVVPRLSRVEVGWLLGRHLETPEEIHSQRGNRTENRILMTQDTGVIRAPNFESLALRDGKDHAGRPRALALLTS